MKHSELINDDISLYIDESESTLPVRKDEIKRTNWILNDQQECGLPPTGKRSDNEHSNSSKTSNRIRMRSRPTRTYQLQSSPSINLVRPTSFNERLISYSSTNHRRESSPSIDKSDFLTDTSSISSRICSPTTLRPLLGTYQSSLSSPISSIHQTCSKSQDCSISQDTSKDIHTHSIITNQTDSIIKPSRNSCLKTSKTSGRKKSVHFDCHSPIEIPSSNNNEIDRTRQSIINKRNHSIDSLTTHITHRSFSLSPSSRKHRTKIKQESIENINQQHFKSINNHQIDQTITQPIGLHTFLQTAPKRTSINSTLKKSKRFSADIELYSHEQIETNSSSINRTSILKTHKSTNEQKSEPFYHSTDDSSIGTTIQKSTLIISTPPQYHYYLYPSIISKKNSTTNISMNSISTNSSSSSSSSYDLDDDTLSNATYSVINPTTINPPVFNPDSTQNNFWPPPPSPATLENDSEDTLIEQNKQISSKISENSSNESFSMININENNLQSTYMKPLKKENEYSFDDTLTSSSSSGYIRRTSRSINMSRARSKDSIININDIQRTKSAGSQILLANDFQSKRQFFENRISSNSPCRHVTKCSWNDLSSSSKPTATSIESTIRTTKATTSQLVLPSTIQRKPVRIVRAVQRSIPNTSNNNNLKIYSSTKLNFSSQYIRNLFPISNRSREYYDLQTIFNNENSRSTDDSILNLKKRLDILIDNQRLINDEIERNTNLGNRLIKLIESQGDINEIEKLKLHINEIETITSVLLKLSCRLVKIENDLTNITDDNIHMKNHLLEQQKKIREKHDEAKCLKDGIDRRSRLVTNILRKYFTNEQFDDYEHFIRMKSTLIMDAKDFEENIILLRKQLDNIRIHSHV